MTETTPEAVAPTPTPDAPAEVAETPESSPGAVDTSESSAKEEKTREQKRYDELTWLRRQAERRTKSLESENAKLREQLTQRQTPQQAEPDTPRKTLADFNYDEEAFEKYVEDRSTKVYRERYEKERTETSRQERLSKFHEREEAFRKEFEDYDEVAKNDYTEVSVQLAEMITTLPDGPQIAYHLGKNPSMAKELSSLHPNVAAARLALLSDRLANERAQAKAKPVSKAPPPPPSLEGSSEGTANVRPDVPEDADKLSDAEWTRRRKKQLERQRSK